MQSHGLVVGVLLGVLACGAAEPAARATAPSPPERITPAWWVANFPNCVDRCEARDALWLAIRDRPDLLDALIRVIEAPVTGAWTRANAILRLGATGQEPAYRYIRDRLAALPGDDPDAATWILALGSGQGPVSALVYEGLAAQLTVPYRGEAAIFVLGGIGTARARAILEETAATSTDPLLRESIERALREWEPRPEREPR